jgi:peroxiredoxin (alkyl hydroperoxide reductase subunit C)
MEAQAAQLKSIPRINDIAPDFKAMSTHGEITLSQFTQAGKWVLLFSHPADFTPVCTTEFIEFSRLAPEFEKRDVQPIGLSVDSIYSHLGWEQNIEKNFGQKIPSR